MVKKIINYLIIISSCILYIYLMFCIDIYNNAHKELGYVYIIILTCIVLLMYSFSIAKEDERKKIIKIYLVLFLLVVSGFVFANFRTNQYVQKRIITYDFNLIPFKSTFELINNELGIKFGIYNIIGNFLMLTPLSILLPLISKKFTKKSYFFVSVFLISISIELLQFTFNIGSFDIDDVILNCFGSILLYLIIFKTSLFKYIEKFFISFNSNSIIFKVLYWIFVVIYFVIFFMKIQSIFNYYQNEKISYENKVCLNNNRTYITSHNNYDYYSECTYDNLIIKQYNGTYTLKEFIEKGNINDVIMKELNITKEIIVSEFIVQNGNGIKKVFTTKSKYSDYYFYNIDQIYYIKKNEKINLIDGLNDEDINIFDFVDIIKDNSSQGYTIFKGDSFDIVSCSKKYSNFSKEYICTDYKTFDYNLCNDVD